MGSTTPADVASAAQVVPAPGRRTVTRSISFPPRIVERLDGLVATGHANSLSELVVQATRELLRSMGHKW